MSRRIDPPGPARGQAPRPTTSFSLAARLGSLEILKVRTRCGCSPCPAQIRRTEEALIPTVLAIAGAVQ
jgi:hypothetical protein